MVVVGSVVVEVLVEGSVVVEVTVVLNSSPESYWVESSVRNSSVVVGSMITKVLKWNGLWLYCLCFIFKNTH